MENSTLKISSRYNDLSGVVLEFAAFDGGQHAKGWAEAGTVLESRLRPYDMFYIEFNIDEGHDPAYPIGPVAGEEEKKLIAAEKRVDMREKKEKRALVFHIKGNYFEIVCA